MTLDLAGINWIAVIVATVVYFALGAVMFAPFTPIGRAWVASSGYLSPTSGMSSSNVFYIVPALTSFVSVLATALLVRDGHRHTGRGHRAGAGRRDRLRRCDLAQHRVLRVREAKSLGVGRH